MGLLRSKGPGRVEQGVLVRVINVTRGTVLVEEAQIASSFLARGRGLLGRKGLRPGEGLILRPCSSIHTFFMRFSIDVVFVDRQGRVREVLSGVKPFRVVLPVPGARWALELPAGAAAGSGTKRGDVLREEGKDERKKLERVKAQDAYQKNYFYLIR